MLKYLRTEDLTQAIQNSDIDIIKKILVLNKEESFDWFNPLFDIVGEKASHSIKNYIMIFFNKIKNSMSSPVKNIIINYINKDKLEELSFFFDLAILNYLDDRDKKLLYEFLEKEEIYFQSKNYWFEREYYNKILEKVS